MHARFAIFALLFSGFVLLSAFHAAAQVLEPSLADAPQQWEQRSLVFVDHVGCGKACLARRMQEAGLWQPGQLVPGMRDRGPGATDPTDVLDNNLAVEVSPPGGTITGSNTMTIRSNVNGLSTFTFRLRWNFTVTACTVTDSVGSYTVSPSVPSSGANPPTYGRTFNFLRPIAAGQTFTVKVDYTGTLAENIGLGSVEIGTQNDVSGEPGVVCTLSEPYYAGTWWPCKDGDVRLPGDNSDKATLTLAITAPDIYTSVANGALISTTTPVPGKTTYTYRATTPMSSYLVAFSTSVYTTWTVDYVHPGGIMPVRFDVYTPNDRADRRAVWEKIPSMLTALRGVYGEYPFLSEGYGIYQFEFGGGMEHQTRTGQGGINTAVPAQLGAAFDEGITVHELGHQWWGDWVTCKTWNDIWLNEGFATYTEALWAERKPGSSGLPALFAAMASDRPGTLTDSVYVADTSNANRVFSPDGTYRKASWVLHMLRHVVGDSTFFNILAAHRAAHGGSAATTADFTALAASVAGRDLSWYFTPWLYGIGAPTYQYAWRNDTIGGQPYLRVMVKQIQQTANPTWPLFPMPIDIRVDTPSGPQTRTVFNAGQADHFLIPLTQPATGIAFDEFNWILSTARTSVAYVAGPPKIAAVSVAPGSSFAPASPPTAITIQFSDNVSAAAPNFAVTKAPSATPVPFTFAYSPATFAATLTFSAPLTPGTYNVAVSDAVTAGGIALDGELSSNSSAALPSGNGQPGGIAAYSFTVDAPPPCAADFNTSGAATVQDIFDFLAAWFAGQISADFNHSGAVSVQDIFDFLAAWFAGCP